MNTSDPNPYASAAEEPPPPRETRPAEASTGQRLAGAFLIANAVLVLIWIVTSPSSAASIQGTAPSASGFAAVVDLVTGISLVRGRSNLVWWATLRSGLGFVLFVVLALLQLSNLAMAVVQSLVSIALLLLLIGDAGKARVIVGASAFGMYALFSLVSLVDPSALRRVMLRADGGLEPEPVHKVTGIAYPYTLELPGDQWRLRKAEAAKKDQPLADRWLVRPDKGAHVMTIVERVPGKVLSVEGYANATLDAQRKASTSLEVIDSSPLQSDPEGGRILHVRYTASGMAFERYTAVVTVGELVFQIIASSEQARFGAVAEELRQIVESFQVPPDATRLSAESDLEASSIGEIEGVASPYKIKAPGRRWYLFKAEAAKKVQPLADRWLTRPDRDAHVIIIVEHALKAKLTIDAYTDAVLVGITGRNSTVDVVEREPLKTDPIRGRFLHLYGTKRTGEREYVCGVVRVADRGFRIIGFAERATFSSVDAELREIIDSFRLPPE